MSRDITPDKLLLGIDSICEKLSLSRSSFERLRNGKLISYIKGKIAPFPSPVIMIGRRPLWSVDHLNAWINQ